MKELIFSVEQIFDTKSKDGALSQYDCYKYHIPAYQRGYKWSSDTNGAVSVLLDDLWEAFQNHNSNSNNPRDYYLQYITVKETEIYNNGKKERVLEVIDGQQRLTTLSILISVLAYINNSSHNISSDKLHYAIRENFLENYIYNHEGLSSILKCLSWKEFIKEHSDLNKQDIFYLYKAAVRCYDVFNIEKDHAIEQDEQKNELLDFISFLYQRVRIILNSVERNIESETVFKNLNSNKVPLTEAELIKGWFITKVGRENKDTKHFKEILEIRANIGKEWDDISHWANSDEIQSFYFNGIHGMHSLLELTAKSLDQHAINDNKSYPLFNYFQKHKDIVSAYIQLKRIYSLLKDWYTRDDLYNLIGFCFFVKGNSKKNPQPFLIECLKHSNIGKFKSFLETKKSKLLECDNFSELRYGDNQYDHKIHAILLSLSVFPKFSNNRKTLRFNFHQFDTQNWTLEHVFPQNPEGKGQDLDKRQKELVSKMLGDKLSLKYSTILEKESRSDEEKRELSHALRGLKHLNSIGNLCLLSGSDNSSNGCKFFLDKRENILALIQKGSFVPKHTFDLFSKMIPGMAKSENEWSSDDIDDHAEYIKSQIMVGQVL